MFGIKNNLFAIFFQIGNSVINHFQIFLQRSINYICNMEVP